MKPFISTAVYGVLNYIIALTLIASPWLFGFVNVSSAALLLPMYIGWLQLIMAIFTNNETGFIKQFPIRIHFVLDVLMGFIILVSPWLYTFSSKVFWPQLILGGILFGMGLFTKHSPFTTKYHKHRPEGLLSSTDSL
ncbi:MAG: SPW repeat domain-containing protein [Mucilaginibacter sp.]